MLAAMISFALAFSLAASTIRTTIIVLGGIVLVMIFGSILVPYINATMHKNYMSPGELLYIAFTSWPGPFAVFSGSWALIDV
jgi:hypothetical protein